jgi:hypothetical protein
MTLTRTLGSAGTISFWAATYSFWGGNCNFSIDAVCKLVDNSGFTSYAFYSYPVSAGTHTFFWNASPDTAGYMYLDDVTVGVNASNPTAAVFHGGNVGIGTTAPNATLEVDGNSIFKAASNVTSTLQIQNASGDSLFNADTTNTEITIGRFVDVSLGAPASPGAAAGATTGGTLSGAAGTTYYYKVSAMTVDGETPLSSEVSINGQSFTKLSAPGALTVGTPSAGGSVTLGTHSYKITFVTANGETTGGTTSSQVNVTTGGTQTVPLTAIPTGPSGTTQRKIYRTIAGDAGSYLLLTTLADNSTTTYNDTTADGSLGAAAPVSNTATTNTNTATITWSAVTGATSYRVYRGTASGAETSYQTIASSPFTDTGTAGTSLSNTSLAIKGTTNVQNVVDSTTAFQIQNASGASLFTIDTTNSKITLGAPSATPVLLVLGNKNTSGDPTCTSGAVYYNSNTSQFRACQNGIWTTFGNGLFTSNVNQPTVSNTATETAYAPTAAGGQSYTLPANYCVPGRIIHISASGTAVSTSADSYRARIRLDNSAGQLLSDDSGYPTSASTRAWSLELTLTCITSGASGTANIQGKYYAPTGDLYGNSNAVIGNISGNITINTTLSHAIVVTGQWNTANSNYIGTMNQFTVTSEGP